MRMIKEYLAKLKSLIAVDENIKNVEIIKDSIRESDIEIIALIRYKLFLSDNSVIELTERLIESQSLMQRTKYSYHWQDSNGELIVSCD